LLIVYGIIEHFLAHTALKRGFSLRGLLIVYGIVEHFLVHTALNLCLHEQL
jgi:hypothetical protein